MELKIDTDESVPQINDYTPKAIGDLKELALKHLEMYPDKKLP